MNKPVVSISCITYNHAPYIRECLDGFMMQKCDFDFEVLIHDDASTDGTQEIIKEYQEKYPEIIKPIFQTENQYSKGVRGIMSRFNFPRAKGKYIALCEGDDYWTDPLKLQKQVDFMEINPEVSFSFHNAKTLNSKGEFGNYFSYNSKYFGIIPKKVFIKMGGSGYATASVMLKKTLINSFIDDVVQTGAPGDFCLALFAINSGEIGYIEDKMAVYRLMAKGSWSTQTSKEFKLKNNTKVLQALEMFNKFTDDKFVEDCKGLKNRVIYHRFIYKCLNENRINKLRILLPAISQVGLIYYLKLLKNQLL